MSFFEKVFGSKKGNKAPSPQEAIQRLREVEEMLMKKSDFLEKKIEHELCCAKKAGTKNKRVALQALKRKKRYEKQLEQIDGTLSTVEFQCDALENAKTTTEVFKVMKGAADALKGAQDGINVDQVHDVMDDIAEQHEVQNEITEAISKPVGFGQEFDDEDLLDELESLEQEDLDEALLNVAEPSSASLPSVPTTNEPSASVRVRRSAKNEADDEDLAELNAWAAA